MYYPVGVSDFKKLITFKHPANGDGYAFVDKTHFINEVINDGSEVVVITRPRRFGKTINSSMLSYFYDIRNSHDNRKLFIGLKVAEQKTIFDVEQGKYPVIFISFKDVKQKDYRSAEEKLRLIISELFKEHVYLLDNPNMLDIDKARFKCILECLSNRADLENCIKFLSQLLYVATKIKPIVLIDEYDTPILSGYLNHYYDDMADLMSVVLP